ncbi:MAG: polyprenyl synthetase family protein [Pseudomonadota bacterium]
MPAQPASSVENPSEALANPGAVAAIYGELLADDLAALNHLIPRQLTSDVALVEEIGRYIVDSGGKRLRPVLVILAARALGHSATADMTLPGPEHIRLAAVIEFLHTATLLHDDVVDRSGLRRGQRTANAVWGNAPSVLVGDFLYSRAFQLMVGLGSMSIMGILSNATNTIAEGEVQQLAKLGDLGLNEDQYMEVIRCKTALLFEAATHTGAVLAGGSAEQIEAMRRFGLHFGLAYQLMDDYLDYAGNSAQMGKNAGDDLAEGKVTLPLIYGIAHASSTDSDQLQQAIRDKSTDALPQVLAIVRECGALAYTQERARAECLSALEQLTVLPHSPYRQALQELCDYSLSRLA